MSSQGARFRNWHAAAILAFVCALLFAQSFRFGLVLDDFLNISEHPGVRGGELKGLAGIWSAAYAGLYVPVTYSVWLFTNMAARALSASPVAAYHAANVFFHGLNACLAYGLIRELTGDGSRRADPYALAGALLFLVHPLQVESVVWITGLKDVLSATLSLVALGAGLASLRDSAVTMKNDLALSVARPSAYVLGLVAFTLALLAKPTHVVLPAAFILIQVFFLRRGWQTAAILFLPWFLVGAVFAAYAARGQGLTLDGTGAAPIWFRPVEALSNLWFYLAKAVLPLRLSMDYGLRPEAQLARGQTWLQAGLCLALLAGLFVFRRRAPVLLGSVALFALALLPTLGLLASLNQEISDVTDHYAYLALLGAGLAAASVLRRASARFGPAVPAAAAALALGAFAALANHRVGQWSEHAPCQEAVDLLEEAGFAHECLAKLADNQGDLVTARGHLEKAYALNHRPQVTISLSAVHAALGDPGRAIELCRDYLARHAPGFRPGFPVRTALAHLLIMKGQLDDGLKELDLYEDELARADPSRDPISLAFSHEPEHVAMTLARRHPELVDLKSLERAARLRPRMRDLELIARVVKAGLSRAYGLDGQR